MKKQFFIYSLLVLFVLSACDNTLRLEEKYGDSPLETLVREIPDIKKVYRSTSDDIREYVIAPSVNAIPFNVEEVSMHINDTLGEVSLAYFGEDKHVKVAVYEYSHDIVDGNQAVKLDNNITGYYHNNELLEEKSLIWRHPNFVETSIIYKIGMVTFKKNTYHKTNNTLTKQDAINIANSIIDQY
ncbi:hypothetical protein BN1058_01484 [Paraliobacillus sp. PM-2]|uniref:hypothetical protein n=1 Tax=Paraliobacillus sp. PM-2 TaxID=1462524 RepID=UPI00061C27B4|nr:hypothetical protein [Paraliobacillus sp. PM-2]CQR47193.1 hypothetical protein BN1058_01484 [Paraliobacillus sp. PM-2]